MGTRNSKTLRFRLALEATLQSSVAAWMEMLGIDRDWHLPRYPALLT
jgi:hypothetical protein